MKWIRDAVGERRRLWYDDEEIESIVRNALLSFDRSGQTFPTDLEALAEQHCNVNLDQHAVLSADILGVTEFQADGRCRISINRELTLAAEAPAAPRHVLGRWRATLAHEMGHVLLHRILNQNCETQIGFFDDTRDGAEADMRCFRGHVGIGVRTTDWREVQANKAMAALLMPRDEFTMAFENICGTSGAVDPRVVVEDLATRFVVSRHATLIRIRELGLTLQATTLF